MTDRPSVVPPNKKRLIVCCDGTWMNSDTGYERPTICNPIGKSQTPSNVTRVARSLRRQCRDGTVQIIEYQSGVGTGITPSDIITGGALGLGISENIRVAYSFLCANYVDGDEIILVGFSRGAFTARSVAGMIGDLGLLTREGMEYFYPIFKDMQNWRTPNYKDPFPGVPFDEKPQGENAEETYRQMLLKRGLTRVYQNGGKGPLIRIRAVAVWDTVGSLGIPNISWLTQLGLHRGTKEFRFYDTNLSDRIEYAFHALALDEHRPPFSPTVWERHTANRSTTELRQVWFPGNHANVGGGWPDAGVANLSLAWMMDQLASIGVEFDEATITRIFTRLERYYRDIAVDDAQGDHSQPKNSISSDDPEDILARLTAADQSPPPKPSRLSWLKRLYPATRPWAIEPIYRMNVPVRPWGLGAIQKPGGFFYRLAGEDIRSPNMYHKLDPSTGRPSAAFLEDTNERMHSSVRIRLALKGLGLNDQALWKAPALKSRWKVKRTTQSFTDSIQTGTWEPQTNEELVAVTGSSSGATSLPRAAEGQSLVATISGFNKSLMALATAQQRPLTALEGRATRWVWEYCGPESEAPPQRLIVEEPLGPYERQLLRLSGGSPNVYAVAEYKDVVL